MGAQLLSYTHTHIWGHLEVPEASMRDTLRPLIGPHRHPFKTASGTPRQPSWGQGRRGHPQTRSNSGPQNKRLGGTRVQSVTLLPHLTQSFSRPQDLKLVLAETGYHPHSPPKCQGADKKRGRPSVLGTPQLTCVCLSLSVFTLPELLRCSPNTFRDAKAQAGVYRQAELSQRPGGGPDDLEVPGSV